MLQIADSSQLASFVIWYPNDGNLDLFGLSRSRSERFIIVF
jgi:hypothetical protein